WVLRDSVDPFDLNALSVRDLNAGSWQRALIRPHLAWWQFRVQLDLSGTHMYPQAVPLFVRLVWMQDGRHPQSILEPGKRRFWICHDVTPPALRREMPHLVPLVQLPKYSSFPVSSLSLHKPL